MEVYAERVFKKGAVWPRAIVVEGEEELLFLSPYCVSPCLKSNDAKGRIWGP